MKWIRKVAIKNTLEKLDSTVHVSDNGIYEFGGNFMFTV